MSGLERTAHRELLGGVCHLRLELRIVTERTVGINRTEHVGRDIVGTRPYLGIVPVTAAERASVTGPGRTLLTGRAGDIHLKYSRGRQGKVKVRTRVDTVVTETGVITATVVYVTEKVTFMHEVDDSEVAHKFCTAADRDISIIRHGMILEQIILPVHVGITLKLFQVGGIAILVQYGKRSHVAP